MLGGGNQFIDPQFGAVGYRAGDRFVICSDGVIDGLWDHHIDEVIRNPEAPVAQLEAARRLVETAVENSGRDNTTAVVVEIGEPVAQ